MDDLSGAIFDSDPQDMGRATGASGRSGTRC